MRAGATVRVISPELTRGLARLAEQKKIGVMRRRYRKGDIAVGGVRRVADDAPFLVFAATNDAAAQRAVRKDAAAAGALVNLANSAEDSDFIVPASFTSGNLHVAISTSGTDPGLSRLLRQRLTAEAKKGKRQMAKVKRQK